MRTVAKYIRRTAFTFLVLSSYTKKGLLLQMEPTFEVDSISTSSLFDMQFLPMFSIDCHLRRNDGKNKRHDSSDAIPAMRFVMFTALLH
ncbi:MAG: hypothetical protein EAZ92_06015 [Candidatus Kapaibacterium sp.]|nr:MAG: hypothetical protein EAZ92_06015 [Candidatus Kapabacteria bacterium]